MLRMALLLIAFLALLSERQLPAQSVNEPTNSKGIVPQGADGHLLNLGFESGDLSDWTASGEAWRDQPVKGEIDQNRPYGKGRKSLRTGEFWLGGYEKYRDTPKGVLTSVPFKVTANWCSFLIGGGNHIETRVELVRNDNKQVFFKISGKNAEEMSPVVVNLASHAGKEIFIRVVDDHAGGWGHVNFDDFRLHEKRPTFKLPVHTPVPQFELGDLYPFEDLSGEDAAAKMIVPDGFRVQLAAKEPDVMQPIAMAIDDRGRVWIAEAYAYPVRAAEGKGRDRILILEDTNLDGVLDSRKIFIEGLNLVSGLEIGFGGVWVGAAPYLMFIPDQNGDDIPDETPSPELAAFAESQLQIQFPKDVPAGATVLLDGFGYQDTHETLNAFIWGPDGWLYGCHGVFTHSKVGLPGTPDDARTGINAGIWRYHPTLHRFELFSEGTSNPWGVDFNDRGDAFETACVIPHLYHMIPGARYQRQGGQHFNPFTFDDIKTIARHRHFVGNQWNNNDRARSDDLGGGHAHAGAMIYQGGREGQTAPEWKILKPYQDHAGWKLPTGNQSQGWPEEFYGKLFMNNIHGNRINIDQLTPTGSGYEGDAYPDFLLTRDKWSQMIYMTYGPDGQMYVIDWYDQNQCHRREEGSHDRSNGRVFRVSYGNAQPVRVNLQEVSTSDLAQLAVHSENEWYSRHARRILQERKSSSDVSKSEEVSSEVAKALSMESDRHAIRSIALANSTRTSLGIGLNAESPAVRAKAVEWIVSTWLADSNYQAEEIWQKIFEVQWNDSPVVRLAMASALTKAPLHLRWSVLEKLTDHPADASDHNLPLMYWYDMEPLAEANPQRALALAMTAGQKIPLLREYMVRRLGSGKPEEAISLLVEGLREAESDSIRLTFLKGIRGSVAGRENISEPAGWIEFYAEYSKPKSTSANFDVYLYTLGLGAKFGNKEAEEKLKEIVIDEAGAYDERKVVFAFLQENGTNQLPGIVSQLLNGTTLRAEALRAAASVNSIEIAKSIIANYKALNAGEQTDARNALASRANYAIELLNATTSGAIPRRDLSADLIRQLRNLEDPQVTELLQKVWGVVRKSDVDRKKLIEQYLALVSNDKLPQADAHLGRAVFAKTCMQCHSLYGTGGKVGPDITGANRKDYSYLLNNILDPSAVMAKEYQPTVVVTDSGRVITGIIKEETDAILKIQTPNEIVDVPVSEIEARKQSDKSMMPDDLLKNLSQHEARSLLAYLSGTRQVPMAATSDNVNRFFNGRDLTGWRATREEDQSLWSVEDGELVGRSTGIKHNAFLVSEMQLQNFEFTCEVKLSPNSGNSGIQLRSQPLPNGEMKGYQADIGKGWWGKLYEESGRGLLVKNDNSKLVRENDWNQYVIRAVGKRVQTFLNGVKVVDLVDEQAATAGLLALQIHSGPAMEVRFRNLELKLMEPVPPFVSQGSSPQTWPKSFTISPADKIGWVRVQLDDIFRSEGVAIADFNNDGHMDVAAGSQWFPLHSPYASADKKPEDGEISLKQGRGQFVHPEGYAIKPEIEEFDPKGYSNTFCNFPIDVNGDGWLDLLVVDFPGKPTWWFENPGQTEDLTPWKQHRVTPVTNNESPQFLDINGDGQRELLCGFDGKVMGFASPKSLPSAEWKINVVGGPGSPGTDRFSHGIGSGDINGDGRNDILITNGWWEAPADEKSDQPWAWHPAPFGQACSQMYVYDFDGDGDNDVLSASAHRLGIWWHENLSTSEKEQWTTHTIDESFTQTHAVVLADINGDGLPDIVTGKRHWAHGGHDPAGNDPPVLCWFELQREGGRPVWTKHQIDDNSGVGTQFDVADVNGDGLLDIATSNKKGTFLFLQTRE